MDLFLQPLDVFAKVATTRMPEDPNAWPQEILQQLYKEIPYMSDFSPHVVMDKVDAEKGYAFGHITVMNQSETQMNATQESQSAAGLRQVRIPIIIKDGELDPLDLLITDDARLLPLTESRLRSAIFRPQAFDVTSKTPGDQSMIGQLYPPYRQNHGFAGGGVSMGTGSDVMSKSSSALEDFLTKEALQYVDRETGQPVDTTGADASERRRIMLLQGGGEAALGGIGGALLAGSVLHNPGVGAAVGAGLGGLHGVLSARRRADDVFSARDSAVAHANRVQPGSLQKEALKLDYKPEGSLSFDTEEDKKNGQPLEGEEAGALDDPDAPVLGQPAVPEALKTGSILRAVAHTLNDSDIERFRSAVVQDPNVRMAYEKNAGANIEAVRILLEERPQVKFASVLENNLRSTVYQLIKSDEGYLFKTANHACWAPRTQVLSRGEALRKLGSKLVMAADLAGAATVAEDATAEEPEVPPDSDMQHMGPVTEFGLYKVQATDGQELTGYVIPNLIDIDGMPMPVALFTNGSQAAVQPEISGQPTGDESAQGLPTGDMPNGYGAFINMQGDVQATVPLRLQGSFEPAEGQPAVYSGETYDGRSVEVSVQPNIQTVVAMEEGRMLVPEHWQWLPLGQADAVTLVGAEHDEPKEASVRRAYASVEVVAGGAGEFSFRGPMVSKLASAERDFVDLDGAMFLLSGLGVEPNYGIRKLSEAYTGSAPVQIRVGRSIKLAGELAKEASVRAQQMVSRMPALRHDLFKEAGFITDPEAVDTVLSLGFINPENVTTYMSYMPTIEQTQESLCNLLFASRMGLSDVPEMALSSAVRSTEEVLEGLKTIAFQGPAMHS